MIHVIEGWENKSGLYDITAKCLDMKNIVLL